MKKRYLVLVGMLAFCFVIGGMITAGTVSAAKTVKLGAIYPFTGPMALLGEESYRGAELATMLVNQKGGLWGKQIEFVKGDAPNANAGQAEAERLINRENIQIIFGSYSSSISYAASEVANRNQVTYFELGGISDPITERGFKYLFRTCPTASMFAYGQVKFIAEYAAEKLGKAPKDMKVAIVHEDSLYGTTVAKYNEEALKKYGVTQVMAAPYNAKAVDLSSTILKLKKYNADALCATSYITDAILFWRQAKELGYSPKVLVGSGGGHTMKDFQDALGSDVEGVANVDFTQFEVNKAFAPGLDEFIELYKKTYNMPPRSGHSLTNFTGALIMYAVLEKAGSFDPEAVRKAALAYKQDPGTTPSGWGADFDPKTGQNLACEVLTMQWTKEKLVTVWPENAAVQSPIVPMPTWEERAAGK